MLNYEDPVLLDFVRGDTTGISIPAHAKALRSAGEAFLTEAFHRFGTLSADNRIVRITQFESFPGGNSGHKLLLSVEYANVEPGLYTDLFVKFSRDFDDAFRDRRRRELEAEVRLATLSRLGGFPIRVPVACFADFHSESGTGLLITERIAFGTGVIEPLHPKCMDHELAEPLSYYRATLTALARLAAAHKSGLLSPQVDALFPFNAESAAAEIPIPYDEDQLRERVARYASFAAACPQLFPSAITSPAFIARFEREALRFKRHEARIKRFLNADRDYVALCHWNTNIDNAWFWRDASGALQCGLLDWGMVRQMNVTYALWGGVCGASLEIWDRNLDELLMLYVDELHAHGGPQLEVATIKLHLHLSVAMLGLALLMEAPSLVSSRLPDISNAASTLDPSLHRNETARSFLHVFTAFLNLWQTQNFGASLDQLLARTAT